MLHPRSIPLLGIHGRMGSGKSTYAEMVAKHSCRETKIIGFTTPLKRIAREIGWDGQKDKHGRRMLQRLGTEVGRDYNEDVWVDLWEVEADLAKNNFLVEADDMRFANEFNRVRNLGGICVKIKRKSAEPKWWQRWLYRLLPFLQHHSERLIPDGHFDLVIENDGTLEQLEAHAAKLAAMFNHYHPKPEGHRLQCISGLTPTPR